MSAMKTRLAKLEAERADAGKAGTVSVTELGPGRYRHAGRILGVAELAELERTHRFVVVREARHTIGGVTIERAFGMGQ